MNKPCPDCSSEDPGFYCGLRKRERCLTCNPPKDAIAPPRPMRVSGRSEVLSDMGDAIITNIGHALKGMREAAEKVLELEPNAPGNSRVAIERAAARAYRIGIKEATAAVEAVSAKYDAEERAAIEQLALASGVSFEEASRAVGDCMRLNRGLTVFGASTASEWWGDSPVSDLGRPAIEALSPATQEEEGAAKAESIVGAWVAELSHVNPSEVTVRDHEASVAYRFHASKDTFLLLAMRDDGTTCLEFGTTPTPLEDAPQWAREAARRVWPHKTDKVF